ncbi:inner centromere protein A-like isoform X1 [Echeneis naucrates]|uniref:Inner centromere protein A-like n=1 Tax=Echeneis naucrates TaxID=173247 RepID=A0A665UCQ3_ECHNA|nr:inner centromere protein A-like isoform X1 [Echeneis naucrates]
MNAVLSSVRSLMQMFDEKTQEFISDIDNVHMVWLEEIQQEANRMFSRDFNAEPELMPKTPSQKKNSRRKRVSLGHQEGNQARRRFSRGRRSNLRGSSVPSLNFIAEEQSIPQNSTSEDNTAAQPKRPTRKNKQTTAKVTEDASHSPCGSCETEEVQNRKPELVVEEDVDKDTKVENTEAKTNDLCSTAPSPPKIPSPEVVVNISPSDRLSADLSKKLEPSPGRTAAKIAIAGAVQSSHQSTARCSLKLRHSLAGLRHSMTQESVRRASRRSILKRKAARMGNSTCSSNVSQDSCVDSTDEQDNEVMSEAVAEEQTEAPEMNQSTHPSIQRVTRSVAAHSPKLAPPSLFTTELKISTPDKRTVVEKQQTSQSGRRSSRSAKRKAPDTVEESPTKRLSPPKKSNSTIRPNMRNFLHTVQKNQMLMMTPNSLGRTGVIKSFIKHTTPIRVDPKLSVGIVTKERHKLEALKKKQEQEEERMKKMEEEKKRKQEELKRKRDERLKRVFEAKVKEEQREEEKKKKIEQKMAQIDEKNDKRQMEEKSKKKVAMKRQEELELKKKLEEEARRKKTQQAEEEKRQQEAKKKAEEEEQRARKLAEARKALELRREQELERERQAAAERERVEKEKALTLQRELERAARDKEKRELEEKRKLEEQQRLAAEEKAAKQREAAAKQAANTQAPASLNVTVDIEHSVMSTPVGKGGGLNVTVDIEKSPQSYVITPKGGNKPLTMSKNLEDYGMDQNSDDSTDDESAPRKPIPSWAEGPNLQQIIMKQYFNPPDLDFFFGSVEPPRLENIFYKSKPRYFKRTSSAVWHSPPIGSK